MYTPACEVWRLLKVSLLVRLASELGPDCEIVKLVPLTIAPPLGSIHSTVRVAVGGRSGSLLVLHINV